MEYLHQRAHVFGAYSLFSHKVTPITLDYFLVDLPGREILLLKPPVEMPNQPELDPGVDPRVSVGCQPGCEQIDVPC
jgi:hypothetical protein